jgi:hypothetical protein
LLLPTCFDQASSMRAALSILGLVIVLALVLQQMKRSATTLAPPKPAASAAGAAQPPAAATEAVRQQVQDALNQGAQRASEATL